MSLSALTDYYSSLLAYQYRGQPNATRQIRLWTKQAVADLLAGQLASCFDVDTAVGAQLDTIGKYIGAPRNVGIVIARPFFGFWTYNSLLDPTLYQGVWNPVTDDPALPDPTTVSGHWYVVTTAGASATPVAADWNPGDVIYSDGSVWASSPGDNGNGLTAYGDIAVNPNGIFNSYNFRGTLNSDLTDAEYRTVIKLKIILNSNDGTLASIMTYLREFFPRQIALVDNQDMTLSYSVVSTVALSRELLTLYLPRPMGVAIDITLVSPLPGDAVVTEEGDFLITEETNETLVTEPT